MAKVLQTIESNTSVNGAVETAPSHSCAPLGDPRVDSLLDIPRTRGLFNRVEVELPTSIAQGAITPRLARYLYLYGRYCYPDERLPKLLRPMDGFFRSRLSGQLREKYAATLALLVSDPSRGIPELVSLVADGGLPAPLLVSVFCRFAAQLSRSGLFDEASAPKLASEGLIRAIASVVPSASDRLARNALSLLYYLAPDGEYCFDPLSQLVQNEERLDDLPDGVLETLAHILGRAVASMLSIPAPSNEQRSCARTVVGWLNSDVPRQFYVAKACLEFVFTQPGLDALLQAINPEWELDPNTCYGYELADSAGLRRSPSDLLYADLGHYAYEQADVFGNSAATAILRPYAAARLYLALVDSFTQPMVMTECLWGMRCLLHGPQLLLESPNHNTDIQHYGPALYYWEIYQHTPPPDLLVRPPVTKYLRTALKTALYRAQRNGTPLVQTAIDILANDAGGTSPSFVYDRLGYHRELEFDKLLLMALAEDDHFKSLFMAIARRFAGINLHDIQDTMQDFLTRFLEPGSSRLERLDDIMAHAPRYTSEFCTWIKNELKDDRKKRKRQKRGGGTTWEVYDEMVVTVGPYDHDLPPEMEFELNTLRKRNKLARAVDVFLDVRVDGYSRKDAAQRNECSVHTVDKDIQTAHRRLETAFRKFTTNPGDCAKAND